MNLMNKLTDMMAVAAEKTAETSTSYCVVWAVEETKMPEALIKKQLEK